MKATHVLKPTAVAVAIDPGVAALKQARPKVRRPPPEAFGGDALIDGPTAAAGGGMGNSWWLEEVRAGRAPAPVVKLPRCTRWKLSSVRAYWIAFAERAAGNIEAATQVTARATKASQAAQAARSKQTQAGAGATLPPTEPATTPPKPTRSKLKAAAALAAE
jgi:hypothetical protein